MHNNCSTDRCWADLQEQLDAAVTASNATGLKLGGALRQFEARLSARNDAGARIARLQYAATRRLYADALQRHHAALDAVRAQQLSLLQQQIQLSQSPHYLARHSSLSIFITQTLPADQLSHVQNPLYCELTIQILNPRILRLQSFSRPVLTYLSLLI